MSLNRRLHLLVGTVSVFGLTGILAVFTPTPGSLSAPHAQLAEATAWNGCHDCHAAEGMDAGCLSCHVEISEQLETERGYHAYLLDRDDRRCSECHIEHYGEEFTLVNEHAWGAQTEAAFDHPHVEFELEGKHERLPCDDCHQKKLSAPFHLPGHPETTRESTYLGLDQDCVSCHRDIHSDGLTGPCKECHGQEVFNPPVHFDHSRHFALSGGHAEVTCRQCHVLPTATLPDFQPPLPYPFEEVRGNTCRECHESPHRARFPGPCSQCHQVERGHWTTAHGVMTPPLHGLTGFRLIPPHDTVSCDGCHPAELPFLERHPDPSEPGYQRYENTCRGCHEDVHGGQFDRRYNRCLDCHDREYFRPSLFDREDHARRFPLTGAHQAVACNFCHEVEVETTVRIFNGTPNECQRCHEDPHAGQFARELSGGDCDDCHDVHAMSFAIDPFDHEKRTGYSLRGAHSVARCESCHIETNMTVEGEKVRARLYRGTPTECSACHKDVHRGQATVYGECTECHRADKRWSTIEFDHDKRTKFPLEGAHRRVACSGCHLPVSLGVEEKFVPFKPLGTECRDCHEIDDPKSSRHR